MNAFPSRSPADNTSATPVRTAGLHRPAPRLLMPEKECELREMERAFLASGGIACTEEVTMMLATRRDQPISILARWIVSRDVVSLEWQSRLILPLFQFDLVGMELRPQLVNVIQELKPALTDWAIALWFARPNAWLGSSAPVQVIELDARAVHEAARAERYLKNG